MKKGIRGHDVSVSGLKNISKRCQELGIYKEGMTDSEEAYIRVLYTIKELAEEAKKYNVNIGIEGVHCFVINTPQKMKRLVDDLNCDNVKDITIPSEERHIRMYPMDFEEFLWAMDNEMLMDIMKHSDGREWETEAIFDEIPAQLSKHEKKFKLSDIKPSARMREYKQLFYWLDDAMIVNTCYNSAEPNIGLKMNMERKTLKCYMADTGLLISHAFDENGIVSEEIYKKLLFDKLSFNSGMIIENIVAQMLTASGHKLYFFSKHSREKAEDRMEIDFLISKSKVTNKHNICPIEVKSGYRYTLSSIRKFISKYKEQTNIPYVIHTKDLKIDDGIVYLPLYMTMLL